MTELVSRRMKERKADQNDLRTDDSSPSEGKLLTVSLLSSHSPFPFSFPSGVERRTEGMSVGRSVAAAQFEINTKPPPLLENLGDLRSSDRSSEPETEEGPPDAYARRRRNRQATCAEGGRGHYSLARVVFQSC